MENEKDMNVKIQNASPGGGKNTGSCGSLATYLEHEDDDRLKEGKEVVPFITPDGTPVTKEDVIDSIDADHAHLGKNDDKFYHLIVSPSADEVKAMGTTEKEQYQNALKLIKKISDSYAENFHRDEVKSASDLVIFWKSHFSRGDNEELQFHMHAIVRRKSKGHDGKSVKISPLTTHRNTENGPVKGGFDRKAFYDKCEKDFDQMFDYDRKVAESFEYRNAHVHGSLEEKAEQASRLADEELASLSDAISNCVSRRQKRKEEQNARNETMAKLMDQAELGVSIMRIFEQVDSVDYLGLKLMMIGVSYELVFGPLGGVEDIIISRAGRCSKASEIMNPDDFLRALNKSCTLTGKTPEYVLTEVKMKKELSEVAPPKKSLKHRM